MRAKNKDMDSMCMYQGRNIKDIGKKANQMVQELCMIRMMYKFIGEYGKMGISSII